METHNETIKIYENIKQDTNFISINNTQWESTITFVYKNEKSAKEICTLLNNFNLNISINQVKQSFKENNKLTLMVKWDNYKDCEFFHNFLNKLK